MTIIKSFYGQSPENTAESTTPAFSQEEVKDVHLDMEIISIKVLPKLGNAVELSWGKPAREYNLDWTYGVYYGPTPDEALKGILLLT